MSATRYLFLVLSNAFIFFGPLYNLSAQEKQANTVSSMESILSDLKSGEEERMISAAEKLQTMPDASKAIELLNQAFHHRSYAVSMAAMKAILHTGMADTIREFLRSDSEILRHRTFSMLLQAGDEAIPLIIETRGYRHGDMVVNSLFALEQIGSKALPFLIEALKSEKSFVPEKDLYR